MDEPLSLRSIYGRIIRTYGAWTRTLLPLAVVIFVPLGLLEAVSVNADLGSRDFGGGLLVLGLLLAAIAIVGTSLFGEILYSGAIAIMLTHAGDGEPPGLRHISRHLAYGRLLAVDAIFALLVIVGLLLLVIPGVVFYVWFGLAGAVVEIERSGVRAAFVRSRQLVRGRFWLVLAVVAPIEVFSEGIGSLAEGLGQRLLGHTFWAEWLAASLSNIVITPFFAVAVVLLTVGLIHERDGTGPRLHSAPAR
jgi:hypothetical protein